MAEVATAAESNRGRIPPLEASRQAAPRVDVPGLRCGLFRRRFAPASLRPIVAVEARRGCGSSLRQSVLPVAPTPSGCCRVVR